MQRRLEQDLNSQPVDRKPKRLTSCTTAPYYIPHNGVTMYNSNSHMSLVFVKSIEKYCHMNLDLFTIRCVYITVHFIIYNFTYNSTFNS